MLRSGRRRLSDYVCLIDHIFVMMINMEGDSARSSQIRSGVQD
jgi:hypothetical protein